MSANEAYKAVKEKAKRFQKKKINKKGGVGGVLNAIQKRKKMLDDI